MNKFSPEVFENKDLPFTVNRLSPTIGGEILGIDLSQPIDSNLGKSKTHLVTPINKAKDLNNIKSKVLDKES